ncbi:LysR family transcriptional regulator [Pectobacterium sp. 21LCBS03]|uniref:LysR family transcriptional regulator n=1 Tax=unclassified Pectobacterium TaxID=2627739 RepID=UPI00200E2402|nr:LysR family transcriptional regulator [Pectobacterium sp. 21LCBS03]UPY93817.1 LysR family transcriptional regulator [Pectobacterium sp. 21LCBS03]
MDRITAMKVFVTVVAHKSQTAAAERLDMSRAMVTRYLAELESWLGARLMHRTTRRFGLTPTGEACLLQCKEVLNRVELLEAESKVDETEPNGLLRITASSWLWQTHLSSALTAYMARYPAVKIDLILGEQRLNLVEDSIDLAIRITSDLEPGLIAKKFATCHTVICASAAYLTQNGTPEHPSDLTAHNCLTHVYSTKFEWQFRHQSELYSVPINGSLSTNEGNVLMDVALQGIGIAKLPLYLAAPHLENGSLIHLLPDYKSHEMGIYGVYTSRQFMSKALRALLDFLSAYFDMPKRQIM